MWSRLFVGSWFSGMWLVILAAFGGLFNIGCQAPAEQQIAILKQAVAIAKDAGANGSFELELIEPPAVGTKTSFFLETGIRGRVIVNYTFDKPKDD